MRRCVSHVAAARVASTILLCVPAAAQWTNVNSLAGGTGAPPKMNGPAPKTPDGKPDLSGIWWVPDGSIEGIDAPPKYSLNLAADLEPAALGIRPWAQELMKERQDNMRKEMPASRCLPWPVPAVAAVPVPFQILQTPASIVILHEVQTMWRQIYMDGRILSDKPNPTWLGYSNGRWDGDTLVVDTRGFNDRSWLDGVGHPHSEDLHVIERFHRLDFGHMEIEFTIDDPKTYSKLWTNKMPVQLMPPDTQFYEDVCQENEKDATHLVGK